MGCPGSTRSVFTRAFWAKTRNSMKNAINITSKHGTTIFFSHYNLFLGERKEKLARKARVHTQRVYLIVLMPPGHPITLGGCYPPRPTASTDNTLLDIHNSS